MASAGTVKVDFAADTLRFTQQLKQVTGNLKGMEAGFGRLAGVAQSALAVLGVGALSAFIKSAANAADELGKTADKIGLSTQQLKAFQIAAGEAGVGLEQANKLLTESQKRLGEAAAGTGEAAKYIKLLGLNVADLQRLSPDQLFRTYAESINGLANRSEQLAVAEKLMGESAAESFRIIQAGAPAIDEAAEFTERLGLALDRVSIKQIEAANDSFGRLSIITQSAAQQFASGLAPYIEDFSRRIVAATGNLNALADAGRIVGATMVVGFEIAMNAVRSLQSALYGLAGLVNQTLAAFNELIIRGSAAAANPASVFNPAFQEQLNRAIESTTGGLRASADFNFQRAEESLRKIKSIEQIQNQIVEALEASRVRAEDSVAAQAAQDAAAKAGGITLDAGNVLGLSTQEQFDISNAAARAAAEVQKEIAKDLSESLIAEVERRNEAERDGAAFRTELNLRAEQEIAAAKATTTDLAIGFLQALGTKNKAFAIAAIVLEKAISIQRLLIQNRVAAELAFASQLIPGVPTSLAAATAAKAAVLAQGYISAGLIAATGALQIADVASGGGRAPIGTALNPASVSASGGAQNYGATSQRAVQVVFTGPVFNNEQTRSYIVETIREAVDDRDVLIIGPGSRQAKEIVGG